MKKFLGFLALVVIWIGSVSLCPDPNDSVLFGYYLVAVPILYIVFKIIRMFVMYAQGKDIKKSFLAMAMPMMFLNKDVFDTHIDIYHAKADIDLAKTAIRMRNNRAILIMNLIAYISLICAGCILPQNTDSKHTFTAIACIVGGAAIAILIELSYYYLKGIIKKKPNE